MPTPTEAEELQHLPVQASVWCCCVSCPTCTAQHKARDDSALGTGACFVGNTELSAVSNLTRVNSKRRHLKHRLLWIIQVRYKMNCNCSPGTSDCPSLPSSNSLKHNRPAIQEATYPSKRMKESSPFPCCPKAAWETNSNYKNVNMWTHATVQTDCLTQGCHMFLVMKSTVWHISQ